MIRTLDINISDSDDRLEELDAAVDLASDQDQRTAITAGGKVIAAVVTAEDLQRLEVLAQAALYQARMPVQRGSSDRSETLGLPTGIATRLALLFGALYRDGSTADSDSIGRVLPPKPEGLTIEQHIERWLHGG